MQVPARKGLRRIAVAAVGLELDPRATLTVVSDQPCGLATDPDSFDLDALPAAGHRDLPSRPLGRLLWARHHPRQPEEAAAEKAAQVGDEGADYRLVGGTHHAELVVVSP